MFVTLLSAKFPQNMASKYSETMAKGEQTEEFQLQLEEAEHVDKSNKLDERDELVVERQAELAVEPDHNLEDQLQPQLQQQAITKIRSHTLYRQTASTYLIFRTISLTASAPWQAFQEALRTVTMA